MYRKLQSCDQSNSYYSEVDFMFMHMCMYICHFMHSATDTLDNNQYNIYVHIEMTL